MKALVLITLLIVSVFSKELVIGVVPQQSPVKIFKKWKKFLDVVSLKSGIEIKLQIERSIPEFEKNLYNGVYDLAYANPYHYILAKERVGYEIVVRDPKLLTGVIVTREDSKISKIEDLKNRTILFPAPNAFAATILVKSDLIKYADYDVAKVKKEKFVNSHDSVYKGVVRGVGDSGGGVGRTFSALNAESKSHLKVIHKTTSTPSHPIIISPENLELKKKLQEVFLRLTQKEKELSIFKSFVVAEDSEYDIVRDIALSLQLPMD